MILYLAGNLIWATRIKAAAEDLGVPARPVRTPEMLRARLADSPVRSLIVDLDAGEAAIELIALARACEEGAAEASPAGTGEAGPRVPRIPRTPCMHILAFGPHVETGLMARAQAAGADEVLARGAFDRRLPSILARLGGSPGES